MADDAAQATATAPELRGPRDADRDPLDGKQAVDRAAGPKGTTDPRAGEKEAAALTQEEKRAALDWFLDDDDSEAGLTQVVQLNVAGPDEPENWIDWTIRSLDLDTIDAIRQRHRRGNRQQRREGTATVDEMATAVAIVTTATVVPNLEEIRQRKQAVSAEHVLRHRFRGKGGLIIQLSGKVLELSGYDDDDVREARAARN